MGYQSEMMVGWDCIIICYHVQPRLPGIAPIHITGPESVEFDMVNCLPSHFQENIYSNYYKHHFPHMFPSFCVLTGSGFNASAWWSLRRLGLRLLLRLLCEGLLQGVRLTHSGNGAMIQLNIKTIIIINHH